MRVEKVDCNRREQNRVLACTAEGRNGTEKLETGEVYVIKRHRAMQEGSGRKASGEWSKLGNKLISKRHAKHGM